MFNFFNFYLLPLLLLLLLLLLIILSIYWYFNYCYQYWLKLDVPYLPPKFPLGNTNIIIPRGFVIGIQSKYYYDQFKRNKLKFGGIYLVTQPNLVIISPQLIRDVLVKDFEYFVNRGIYHNRKTDPLSQHLFAIDGQKWKSIRIKLTPTFTSGKMKLMYENLKQCSTNMLTILKQFSNIEQDVDIKEILGRFTTDVIGICAFGVECNSFKQPNAEFRRHGLKIFEFNLLRSIKAFFIINQPKLAHQLGIRTNRQETIEFFTNLIRETIELRKRQRTRRNDFLQLLIDLQENEEYRLTIEEIAAQVFLFFIAGFETSSTTMTFALYELAKNPTIQERLRCEIRNVSRQSGGEITYDNLKQVKYLAQIIDETLRKYPVVPTLMRHCTMDYQLRDTNITIKKGTPIMISTFGLHYDPEYFPNPYEFNPERFNDINRHTIEPYTYLPFGEGPRNCIGLRFGLMQTRLGVAQIIKHFKLIISPQLNKDIELDPYAFLLTTTKTIYLRAEKI